MFKKMRLALIMLVILFFSLGTAFGEDKADLKVNLQKGKIYNFKITTESTVTQIINKSEVKMAQSVGMDVRYAIVDLDVNGAATVKITYTGARLKQNGPNGKITYDSSVADPDIPPAATGFAALIGAEFTIKMSAKGEVLDVQGVDALLDGMAQKLGANRGNFEAIKNNLKKQFGDRALKESVQQSAVVFPGNPIAVGDSWSNQQAISNGYAMTIENTFKLKERKDGRAIIELASTMEPNISAEPMDFGLFKIAYRLSGTMDGTIEIQESSGLPFYGKCNQNLSGEIELINPKTSEIQKWPIKIDSAITFETTEN